MIKLIKLIKKKKKKKGQCFDLKSRSSRSMFLCLVMYSGFNFIMLVYTAWVKFFVLWLNLGSLSYVWWLFFLVITSEVIPFSCLVISYRVTIFMSGDDIQSQLLYLLLLPFRSLSLYFCDYLQGHYLDVTCWSKMRSLS